MHIACVRHAFGLRLLDLSVTGPARMGCATQILPPTLSAYSLEDYKLGSRENRGQLIEAGVLANEMDTLEKTLPNFRTLRMPLRQPGRPVEQVRRSNQECAQVNGLRANNLESLSLLPCPPQRRFD